MLRLIITLLTITISKIRNMTPLTIREQDKEILMVVVVQEDLVDTVETKVILNSNKDKVTHKLVE
jgi:hypothetical protein